MGEDETEVKKIEEEDKEKYSIGKYSIGKRTRSKRRRKMPDEKEGRRTRIKRS